MATLTNIRKHVLDDASELAATTGLMCPLLDDSAFDNLPCSKAAVGKFLQGHLMRHVVLIITRLHEKAGHGSTGETASIASLLNHAVAEKLLTSTDGIEFSDCLESLKSDLADRGVSFAALRRFRNAELAHSLHSGDKPILAPGPIWDFAHNTFELVIEIEKKLLAANSTLPPLDLDQEFHKWRDRGDTLWDFLTD